MVKFDVKPSLTLRPDNSLSGTVKLTTEKWGNEFSATLADEMFKDGFSTTGLRLGVKANALEVDYAVAGHKPKVTFRTAFPLRDRNVGIKYTHNIAARGSDVEASVPIDDDNKATIIYNLTDYNGPDHRNLILKWAHTQKDFTFEPAFNLNTESVQAKVTYQVDPGNKLTASFDTHTRVGTLEWLNSANLGGEGDLKLTASSSLDPSDLGKKMPTLLLEKTFSLDA